MEMRPPAFAPGQAIPVLQASPLPGIPSLPDWQSRAIRSQAREQLRQAIHRPCRCYVSVNAEVNALRFGPLLASRFPLGTATRVPGKRRAEKRVLAIAPFQAEGAPGPVLILYSTP